MATRTFTIVLLWIAAPLVCRGQATITVYAGTGNPPINPSAIGDGGPARSAFLSGPGALAVDAAGNLYIREVSGGRIRKVTPAGTISTIAGTGRPGNSGDGARAISAQLGQGLHDAMAFDGAGNLYLVDSGNFKVRKVDTSGVITAFAGNGQPGLGSTGDGGKATATSLCGPAGVATDAAGNVYIGSSICGAIRKVDTSGNIGTVGRNVSNVNYVLAADAGGGIYALAGLAGTQVRKLNADGTLSTIAGTGQTGFSGDNGPAADARFFEADGLAFDKAGNYYLADSGNFRVRRVDTSGNVTTIAGANPGAGCPNLTTTGCPATNLKFSPDGVAVDASGNVYASESVKGLVYKISGVPSVGPPPTPVVPPPAPPAGTVTKTLSAAGQQAGPFAPESIVVATGTHLATGAATGDLDQPPVTLAGTGVTVADSAGVSRPAVLLSVSDTQVTYQIPAGTATGTATVTITAGDGVSASAQLQIAAVAPGLYTLNSGGLAKGYILRISNGNEFIEDLFEIDENGAVIPHPVTVSNGDQVYLVVYGTGFRGAGADVAATIGGVGTPVLFAGPQGVQPGIDQFNVLIPPELGTGTAQAVQIAFTAAGQLANAVTITVQ